MDDPAQVEVTADGIARLVLSGSVIMVRHEDALSLLERTFKAERVAQVQVDLSRVTSLDSSGLALLILARRLAQRRGLAFALHGASPMILMHLETAGVLPLFGLSTPDGSPGVAQRVVAPPVEPVVEVFEQEFDRLGVSAARGRLTEHAQEWGFDEADVYRLVLAASEIMANAVFHGGGTGRISVARRGVRVLVRVSDNGPGIPRRFQGERPRPRAGRVGSVGLWLARRICERVDIETGPRGTSVLLTYVPGG